MCVVMYIIICVVSQGLIAKAKFHVSYRDKAIIKPLQLVKQETFEFSLNQV